MTRPKSRVVDTGEMPVEEWLQAAVKVYKVRYNSQREILIREVALNYGVHWETVRDRISGSVSRKEASQGMQRLSPFEEGVIEKCCLRLYAWGWPTRIHRILRMAIELLKKKGDTKELGPNWQLAFLRLHPDLKERLALLEVGVVS